MDNGYNILQNAKTGLGWSPSSAGPVGGWDNTPGSNFYQQPLDSLLPRLSGPGSNPTNFGKSKKKKKKSKSKTKKGYKRQSKRKQKRRFGYNLMNEPSRTINESVFPNNPVGPSDTSGGLSGTWLMGLPNFNSFWG